MARMASEHAEATRVPTRMELQNEFEELVKLEYPNEPLATTYTRCYGILLAHITKEQMTEIIQLQKDYN